MGSRAIPNPLVPQVAGLRAASLRWGAVCAGEGGLPALGLLVQQPQQRQPDVHPSPPDRE